MAMKFLVKVKKPDHAHSVKYLLHQHLNGPEPERPLKNVHASELTKPDGICARAYALSDVTKQKPGNRWLSTSENMTFALGRVIQDLVVDAFADMGKAICHWRCLNCNCLHEFTSRPIACNKCGSKRFRYEEVRFESAVSGASCGVDMLLALGDSKLRPIEIKTMAADQFKPLAAPLAEHRLRTNLYLRIIAESKQSCASLVATDRANVLYVSKSAYGCADPQLKEWGLKEGFSPFKEFVVERNDADTDAIVKPAITVKQFRDGEIGMPKGVCSTAMTKRACSCAFKSACFSGEHPAA